MKRAIIAIIAIILCQAAYADTNRNFYIVQRTDATSHDKQVMAALIKKLDPRIDPSKAKQLRLKVNPSIVIRILCYDFKSVLVRWDKATVKAKWEEIEASLDNPAYTEILYGRGSSAWIDRFFEPIVEG